MTAPRIPEWAAEGAKALGDRATATPAAAVVLGTGLAGAAGLLSDPVRVPYADVEGMPSPTVPGHDGTLAFGFFGSLPVVVLAGRVHLYEGASARACAAAADLAAALGCRAVVLTNAAGGLREAFAPGDFMVVADHLNLTGENPLRGEAAFVDLAGAYDDDLKARALRAARGLSVRIHQGVYAAVPGPSYETRAETEMIRRLGADAVGMSTVHETIVARAHGLRVLGISCITDVAGAGVVSHEAVLDVARGAAPVLGRIVEDVLADGLD